jgi:ankyrin repeat protein
LQNDYGLTALTWAAFKGHTAIVKVLLDAGAQVNSHGSDGKTALVRVIVKALPEQVNLLYYSFDF